MIQDLQDAPLRQTTNGMRQVSDISAHYTSGDLLARLEARLHENGFDPQSVSGIRVTVVRHPATVEPRELLQPASGSQPDT